MIEPIVLIVVAFVVTIIAVALLFSLRAISKKGIEVEGVVFDLQETIASDQNTTFPIIRFVTIENNWITKSSKIATLPGQYKKGKKVIVVYQKDNPDNFFIKSNTTYLIPFFMIIISTSLLIYGIYIIQRIT